MCNHFNKLTGFLEQLTAMDAALSDTLAVGIPVESIEVNALMPVTVSIKTLAYNDLHWGEIASRFIEEETALLHGSQPAERSSSKHDWCGTAARPVTRLTVTS